MTSDTKTALAAEIASIHSAINHVPSTYVNVVFHELATEIAAAVTALCGVDAERVLATVQSSPAQFAVEGGRVLPERGNKRRGSRRGLTVSGAG